MNQTKTKTACRVMSTAIAVISGLLGIANVHAEVPGITGPAFNLTASADFNSQPDGNFVYSWGYGCTTTPLGFSPVSTGSGPVPNCPMMQMPGPTMIVKEGDTVTVTLTNALPPAAER